MIDYTFRRGDICWFNDPVPVHGGTYVMHGRHPAVIVSDDGNNINGDTAIIVMITSNVQKRMYPGQFDINLDGTPSRVRCDQIRVVDKTTLDKPHARLAANAIEKLDTALVEALGINNTCTGFKVAGLIKED